MENIEKFTQENAAEITQIVEHCLPIFEKVLKDEGIQSLVDFVYHQVDTMNEQTGLNNEVTCSSGCSFCCSGRIVVSSFEASYITSYLKQFKVQVDLDKIKLQNSVKRIDDLKFAKKTCALLDDSGKCKIYNIRPLICRLWNSIDDPKLCDREKYNTPTKTARTVQGFGMLLTLAKMDINRGYYTANNPYELHKALNETLVKDNFINER